MSVEVTKALAVMLQISGREMTDAAAEFIVKSLMVYPEAAVLAALNRCALELPRFPALSEIIERIEDGRPGAEAAWAMIPRSEDESACWTSEMTAAYGDARALIHDKVAGRLAFVETYRKLCAEARAARRPVQWSVTLGHDKGRHAAVLKDAVEKGRLSERQAQELLPDLSIASGRLQLTGPEIPVNRENIQKIREMILMSVSIPPEELVDPELTRAQMSGQARRMKERE